MEVVETGSRMAVRRSSKTNCSGGLIDGLVVLIAYSYDCDACSLYAASQVCTVLHFGVAGGSSKLSIAPRQMPKRHELMETRPNAKMVRVLARLETSIASF